MAHPGKYRFEVVQFPPTHKQTPRINTQYNTIFRAFANKSDGYYMFSKAPALMKADIDAAFRRIPVKESHRWAATVTWLFENEPWMASHIGMPFGAAASGIAWHKVGHLLDVIARKLLGIPMLRYVDDYFAVDR